MMTVPAKAAGREHRLQAIQQLCLADRWDNDNGPEQTDLVSNRNLFAATPRSIQRFVFATSTGVERYNQFPFFILNLFGACCLHAFSISGLVPGCQPPRHTGG